jgi:hypothetical protein
MPANAPISANVLPVHVNALQVPAKWLMPANALPVHVNAPLMRAKALTTARLPRAANALLMPVHQPARTSAQPLRRADVPRSASLPRAQSHAALPEVPARLKMPHK